MKFCGLSSLVWFIAGLYFSATLEGMEKNIFVMGSFIASSVWFASYTVINEPKKIRRGQWQIQQKSR